VIELRVVGYVRVGVGDDFVKANPGAVAGRVEILPEYVEALDGLEGFSHLFIISFLHKAPPEYRDLRRVKPRRLLRRGLKEEELPTLGVFSTDSPVRPNPIGLTLVRLVRRDGGVLFVEGLDLFDGTPVIDIKPLRPDYTTERFRVPEWVRLDVGGRV
jgi:tRNA-Thr(GGU) m(6)t(6)A37 methyltransferase TsaA